MEKVFVLNPEDEELFYALLSTASDKGYSFEDFSGKCTIRNRHLEECEEIWNQFISVAKFMTANGRKTPLEAVMWIVETAFPVKTVMVSHFLSEKSARLSNIYLMQEHEK